MTERLAVLLLVLAVAATAALNPFALGTGSEVGRGVGAAAGQRCGLERSPRPSSRAVPPMRMRGGEVTSTLMERSLTYAMHLAEQVQQSGAQPYIGTGTSFVTGLVFAKRFPAEAASLLAEWAMQFGGEMLLNAGVASEFIATEDEA